MSEMIAKTVSVESVSAEQKLMMFGLMQQYYDQMSPERFEKDLASKDDVILLFGKGSDQIKGFSTLKTLNTHVHGRKIRGLFSGDTVVDREYWGQRVLGREFLKYLFIQKLKSPFMPFYWMLISKGYKTYLLLANNFPEHYPRYEHTTPEREQGVLDSLSEDLFGDCYKKDTGLIEFTESLGQLKPGIADVPCDSAMLNPRINFFATKNPTWAEGTELSCIARMTWTMPIYYALKSWWKLVGRRWFRDVKSTLSDSVEVKGEA